MDIQNIFKKIQLAISEKLSKEEKQALKDNIVKLNEQMAAPAAATDPNAAPAAKTVKTQDGTTTLSYTGDLTPNVTEINIVNPDGTTAPAPDNTYTLEDGTSITVMGGKVMEVSTAQEEGQDTTEMTKAVQQMEAKFSTQTKEIEKSYSVKLAEQKKDFETQLVQLKAVVLHNSKLLDAIVNTPVDTIDTDTKVAKFSKELTDEEYNKLSNADKVKYNRGKL